MVETWTDLFSSIIERHALIKDIRVSDRNCPWVNADLKSFMKSRDRLKKAAVSTKSETLMNSYREARTRVNSLSQSLKKKFYSDRISEHNGNMKETWKLANDLLKKRSKCTNINSPIDGKIEIVEKEISNSACHSSFQGAPEKSEERQSDGEIHCYGTHYQST